MSTGLRVVLIIFAILWFILVSILLKKNKLPIKYSMFWYAFILVIVLLGVFPDFLTLICSFFRFKSVANLVIGLFITMLMFITLILTAIVSYQKKQIKQLIQEVSLIKSKIEK